MEHLCCVLLGYGLGVFTIVFFIAWLDEREDGFCNIVYKTELDTCIDWSLRLQSLATVPVRDIPKKVSMKNYRTGEFIYRKNIERITLYTLQEVDR